ncbi:MAG: HDIG domain-containing protein [Bdellovibrionaceae bacterium]|nr:HDIG domain-containing protein [Pseudobdellovibrionaceae bacterium]
MITYIMLGLILGLFFFFFSIFLKNKKIFFKAHRQAKDILLQTEQKNKAQLKKLQERESVYRQENRDFLLRKKNRLEHKKQQSQSYLKRQERFYSEKIVEKTKISKKISSIIEKNTLEMKTKEKEVEQTKKDNQVQKNILKTNLENSAQANVVDMKEYLKEKRGNQLEQNAKIQSKELLESLSVMAEKKAKNILHNGLNRFTMPYCPHRGIGIITFNSDEHFHFFCETHSHLFPKLESICELTIKTTEQTVEVLTRDPMRRKWASDFLEKILFYKKPLQDGQMEEILKKQKNYLLKTIQDDGKKAFQKLQLKPLHNNILNVFGTLQYRYSFTQNQYAHCLEVGFLCGLLASEIDAEVKKYRLSGLLHDLGKAIDHNKQGGHAVIGADLLARHDVNPDVVYAIRSHHHDTPPKSSLDFLVIAADALSGARPGARRSTANSYNQKMDQLEEIGNSFNEITHTLVLNAGRELRVFVDSKRVSDKRILDLHKELVEKVETECKYPHQIKIMIIRKSSAIQKAGRAS